MSESFFTGFSRFSRPDIGLASDSFSNLSEIFESDKRDALRNIRINPEILDSIYELYKELSDREDLRAASGLDKLLLPSLSQLDEVFLDRIPESLYVRKDFYNPEFPLGGSGGSSQVKNENVVLFNGSIQCESASYRQNIINPNGSIFGPALKQDVTMSSSRASLFNTELDPLNPGYYREAKYADSIRVRRRSHVNRIFLPKTNFIPKPDVLEYPTHTITVPVDNGNTGASQPPLKLLATKNSPLRIYCRMTKGTITLNFTSPTTNQDRYFYGLKIQPAQQRPNTTPVQFLPVTYKLPPTPAENKGSGVSSFPIEIDITNTGFQNVYDLYLYLYVNPSKIEGLDISGIDITEFPDQTDLGLIGFNELKTFKVSGSSMTILPLWLKTLKDKLEILDLSGSKDRWRTGPMGWFDIRNTSASTSNITGVSQISNKTPLYTCVSYLTIPKTGAFLNEDGDWSSDKFSKYILNSPDRVPNVDYRVFGKLQKLILGDLFYGSSPRFDDVFPGLTELDWSYKDEDSEGVQRDRKYRFIFNNLPKIKNNNRFITYNIYGSGASGNITDVGTSSDINDGGYVSKYNMRYFNIGGRHAQEHFIYGYINNRDDGSNWNSWRETTTYIDMNRTRVSIDLQTGKWEQLKTFIISHSRGGGGVKFINSISNFRTPNLNTPSLTQFLAYGSGTDGPLPSLANALSIKTFNIGACNGIDPIVDNGINFLLPINFCPSSGNKSKLENFYISYYNNAHRFRLNDLKYLHELVIFSARYSKLTGKFPIFPSKELRDIERKNVDIRIEESDFYDLSTLSVNDTNNYFSLDIERIEAWNINEDGGGAILPDFTGTNTSVTYINVSNSLTSTYPPEWGVGSLRSACIKNTDPPSTVTGLTLTVLKPDSSSDQDLDSVYILTGPSDLRKKVLVNDDIRILVNNNLETSLGNTPIAKVLSVKETEIIISKEIVGPFTSLVFSRQTVDIGNWLEKGFDNLSLFWANNCRLSGKLNIRASLNAIKDTSYPGFNLSRNMISEYEKGSLTNIFGGNSRKITVDLSSNNLSPSQIRKIVEEVSELEVNTRFTGCKVILSANKLSDSGVYSTYGQSEIFPTTVERGPDRLTSLTRVEQFSVYEEISVADSDGNLNTSYVQVSTQNRQIPGEFISSKGGYFKTKVEKIQVTKESELAVKFRSLKKIRIVLDFIYENVSSGSTVLSEDYNDSTNRINSITDSGLRLLSSCPPGVGSGGTCWEDNSQKIFKLNT